MISGLLPGGFEVIIFVLSPDCIFFIRMCASSFDADLVLESIFNEVIDGWLVKVPATLTVSNPLNPAAALSIGFRIPFTGEFVAVV